MNLSTETSSHKNNTSTIQTRTTQKPKQTYNEKKTKYQHKYSRKWSLKHKIWGEEMRTHTYFLKIWRWKSAKMEFVESDTECLGEFQLREKVNRHKKFEGKLKRFLKTSPLFAKHVFFATRVSRQGKPPKHSNSKLWKKFLSVFCDWKVYSRGSRKLS